jgi:hypothetical protein
MQAQEILPNDLKTLIMAILRINDGKHFFESSESPIMQSEDEIGFRIAEGEDNVGQFCLRYEELPMI